MKEAVALLSRLYEVLEAMGLGGQLDKVRLDFSMTMTLNIITVLFSRDF